MAVKPVHDRTTGFETQNKLGRASSPAGSTLAKDMTCSALGTRVNRAHVLHRNPLPGVAQRQFDAISTESNLFQLLLGISYGTLSAEEL